jgi:hypothetical protein
VCKGGRRSDKGDIYNDQSIETSKYPNAKTLS